jgi:tubby and related proteins
MLSQGLGLHHSTTFPPLPAPSYQLHLDEGRVLLMTAHRRPRRTGGSSYALFVAGGANSPSPVRVAKLRSNLLGTEFTLSLQQRNGSMQDAAAVTYAYNVLGTRGPRVMCAAVPAPASDSSSSSNGSGPPAPPLAAGVLLERLRCGSSTNT